MQCLRAICLIVWRLVSVTMCIPGGMSVVSSLVLMRDHLEMCEIATRKHQDKRGKHSEQPPGASDLPPCNQIECLDSLNRRIVAD